MVVFIGLYEIFLKNAILLLLISYKYIFMTEHEMVNKTTNLNTKTIALIVFVVSVVVAGVSYFFYSSSIKATEKELQQQIVLLQQQLDETKNPQPLLGQQLQQEPVGESRVYVDIAPQVNPEKNNVYYNSEFGFSLTFPKTWNGYSARNRVLNWGAQGNSNSVDFGFAIQDSLFNISVHSKDQWQKINSQEGPKPTYISENGQYVFAYAVAHDASDESITSRMKEIPGIIATFEIKNR